MSDDFGYRMLSVACFVITILCAVMLGRKMKAGTLSIWWMPYIGLLGFSALVWFWQALFGRFE